MPVPRQMFSPRLVADRTCMKTIPAKAFRLHVLHGRDANGPAFPAQLLALSVDQRCPPVENVCKQGGKRRHTSHVNGLVPVDAGFGKSASQGVKQCPEFSFPAAYRVPVLDIVDAEHHDNMREGISVKIGHHMIPYLSCRCAVVAANMPGNGLPVRPVQNGSQLRPDSVAGALQPDGGRRRITNRKERESGAAFSRLTATRTLRR